MQLFHVDIFLIVSFGTRKWIYDNAYVIRIGCCTWHRKLRWNFEQHDSKLARLKPARKLLRPFCYSSWIISVVPLLGHDKFTYNCQWVNRSYRSNSNLVSSRHWTRINKSPTVSKTRKIVREMLKCWEVFTRRVLLLMKRLKIGNFF